MPGVTAGQKANWGKAKFSSKNFLNHNVNSNVKSLPAHLGAYTTPDKMAPKKS